MSDWEDTELIECTKCKAALNGKTLYVQLNDDNETETLCEACYRPPIEPVISDDPITNAANKAGNQYVQRTQHVDLTESDNAEIMIRNLRFMAYSQGFQDGARWKKD
jgi:hypothetical protein